MADEFAEDEIAQLRSNGVVLFAGRVIYEARPPMPEDQIAAVSALCNGGLPPDLVELWRTTAGGRLDYDLGLRMNGNREAISWAELFYNGSDGYHDLDGWINAELELRREAAEARGETWDGTIDAVPIGGFEYTDRIYAVTAPEAVDHGHIIAWKLGLPPAWHGAMHEDGLADIAPDLPTAFARLSLAIDPLAPGEPLETGSELLEYIDVRTDGGDLSAPLADKLIDYYRRAVIDWRTPLADGTLADHPELATAALRYAIDRNDHALAERLAATGMNLTEPIAGSLSPTEFAQRNQAHAVLAALIAADAPPPREP